MNVLITGISSGIGKSLAEILLQRGHTVWGIARRPVDVPYKFSICDTSDPKAVSDVAEAMKANNFLPDIIILNAAIFEEDLNPEFQHDVFERMMKTNVDGALFWVDEFLPQFLKRGTGQFIAVVSTSALRPDMRSAGYPASKAALAMAFRSLDICYRSKGVIFTNIYLGPVATSMTRHKNSWFVSTPQNAAQCIVRAMKGKKATYYYPYLLTLAVRLSIFLPDRFFVHISKHSKR